MTPFLQEIVAVLAITNPLGAVPVFLIHQGPRFVLKARSFMLNLQGDGSRPCHPDAAYF
jgi:hypothetical protein